MIRHKPYWMVLGFLLFSAGIISLILSLVGLEWSPIGFIYKFGGLTSLIFQLVLLISGVIMMYISRLEND